jgi:pimeloyl-ACP methyl ester carboxylesterase
MDTTSEAEATVRAFANLFGAGSFAEATDRLSDDGRAAVVASFPEAFRDEEAMDAADALEAYWWGLHGQYGPFEGVGDVRVDGDDDGDGDDDEVAVELAFEGGTMTATVGVAGEAVTDLSFAPEYEVPSYVDTDAFGERSVTVDAGDVTLDGRLAVPDGEGPFPGVVLVHGAGVHDPDGTVGASKLLKDLAWGLASEGIATLRYEKRLAAHEVSDEAFTLDTVVVDDAVAAVAELVAVDEVATEAVFVAGHSQGGMCAPRIAARHGGLAGVVVLDALADSTPDPDDLRFLRYEFEPDGELSDDQAAELERERETVRRLVEGEFDDDETLWGRPGTWHRSVNAYDPAATASDLDVPVFVLKTGRADEETQPDSPRGSATRPTRGGRYPSRRGAACSSTRDSITTSRRDLPPRTR